MVSKCRKWHLREPKFAEFPGGSVPLAPPPSPLHQKFAPLALMLVPIVLKITPYLFFHPKGLESL